MNYYQHHIGDFNNATRHLTRVERSLYRDLIEFYYDTEKPLIDDVAWLNRKIMARTDEEKEALLVVLNEYFTLLNDGYHNARCDADIEKYHLNSKAKSKAGKASAAKRKQSATPVEHPNNKCATNQEPITINQEPITKDQKKGVKKFTPPSVNEVQTYCTERKNTVQPEKFVDFYESKGWMVGKNKMKNWKACVRTWEKRDDERAEQTKNNGFDVRSRAQKVSDKLDEIARREITESGVTENLG